MFSAIACLIGTACGGQATNGKAQGALTDSGATDASEDVGDAGDGADESCGDAMTWHTDIGTLVELLGTPPCRTPAREYPTQYCSPGFGGHLQQEYFLERAEPGGIEVLHLGGIPIGILREPDWVPCSQGTRALLDAAPTCR